MSNQFLISEIKQPYTNIYTFLEGASSEIIIISPYINPNVLQNILPTTKASITVITTWKMQDIWLGSSSLKIYPYARDNSIKLYVNNRIHLKLYMIDWKKCINGSANLTEKGLGLSKKYNYELDTVHDNIDPQTLLYLRSIVADSILVTDEMYIKYKKVLSDLPEIPKLPKYNIAEETAGNDFLISSLPMSHSIDSLYRLYSQDYATENDEDVNCALHDIALYKISKGLSRKEFDTYLSAAFFDSLFIKKLTEFISFDGKYFGEVKEWIQKHCSDVPVPSRRNLTGNIQVLYRWIVELGNGQYVIERPNYSERIRKVK